MNRFILKCTECGRVFSEIPVLSRCPKCGGVVTYEYDYANIISNFPGRDIGIWRYRLLFPISDDISPVTLGEGITGLRKAENLSRLFDSKYLYIKDESKNPTGSFLDRGSSVLVTFVKDNNVKRIILSGVGNLGASLSAYASKAGIELNAYFSGLTDLGKLYQMIVYGAKLIPSAIEEKEMIIPLIYNIYHVTPSDPIFAEGLKTTAYEIAEDLGWSEPDVIVLSTASGMHLSMIWKGFNELRSLGLIKKGSVRLFGVQVEGCDEIASMYSRKYPNETRNPSKNPVIPDLCAKKPSYLKLAIDAVRKSGGRFLVVSEHEVIDAIKLLARSEGIYAEPAAACALAGLKRLYDEKIIDKDERVVYIVTGSGLKDVGFVERLIESPKIKRLVRSIKPSSIGSVKNMILNLLKHKDMYGYEIWHELLDKGYKLTLPAVYQHLTELEEMGYVISRKVEIGGKLRRYYVLTAQGKNLMK
ncbi:MAG: pyridoxal-phosphate dependent enzyme [Thermoprotei archaeon]|jgi:threonine synthase